MINRHQSKVGERKTNNPLMLLMMLLAAGVFVLDLSMPLGFAGGVPYVLLILLALRSTQRRYTYIMAGVGSALTLLGFFLSPPGGALSIVLLNRFLALFLIWAAAILTIQYKRKIEESTKSKVALHGSEAQYRSLVQTVGSVILYISPDHKIIEFNQEAERVYGRSREEVLGKDYFKLFLPEIVWDSVAADIRKVLAGEPTRGFENPVLTADGNERILLWNVVRMLDDQGEPIGFIACGQDITDLKQAEKELQKAKDEMEQRVNERTAELLQANKALGTEITERKQAEEALRTARKRLEYLISSSPTVIFTGNPVDYTTTFISENVTEMLGYESRQFLEDPRFWANHIHPEDAPRIFAEIGRLSEEGNCTLEYRFRHKNGTHRWMQDRLRLVRDKTDNAPEVIGAWWDITERKEAEEEIEASLKEKEILLQEVHHRVKNNLQIISSLLNLQLSTIKDQAAAAILLESRKRIKSMAIIHETLYRTKDLENVNLTKYIQNLTAQLFAASGINASAVTPKINANNLSMDIDTAIPCGLIINELVSNALKHAFPAGREGEIRIELHSDDSQMHLTVSDNGIGFPKDLDLRNPKSLGLQLVNRLTDQLKGTLKSERNGGSAWKMTFPRPQKR